MRRRDEYKPRHVHRWKLIEKKPAVTAGYSDWWSGGVWQDAAPMKLRRECDDCGVRSGCDVDDESKLVTGYEAVCDFEWKEEND